MKTNRSFAYIIAGLCISTPLSASAYTFGEWASDRGFSPGAIMPHSVDARGDSIDSLNGINLFDWNSGPTYSLDLQDNQLTGIESGGFSGLTSLSSLTLSNNQITSIDAGDFSGLASLGYLTLRNNQITSIETNAFTNLTTLGHLDLDGNLLSSIEAGDFSGLTNLGVLELEGNQILSIKTGDLIGLSNLWSLELGNNQISSIEVGDYSELTNLEYLSLYSNQILSIEEGSFSGLTNLLFLGLSENQISNIESDTFSGLPNLEVLGLGYNQLTSIKPDDFSGLTNLTGLYLGYNQISSIEAGTFNGLPNLEVIELVFNQLTNIKSDDFSGLTNLAVLNLENNQIVNIEAGSFGGLSQLEELFLGDNTNLIKLNLESADFSSLSRFNVRDNDSISSVSLKNAVVNQNALIALMYGGGSNIGLGEIDGITDLDLSSIDFDNITDLEPLYGMDDLTILRMSNSQNIDALALDVLLDELATMESIDTEGVLQMTPSDYVALNSSGGGLLAIWNAEPGHHVELVIAGDFNGDGTCDGADFLYWQRGKSPNPFSQADLATWESDFGLSALIPSTLGDFNGDLSKDGLDFLMWKRSKLPDPSSNSDLVSSGANFGRSAESVSATATTVPEPSTLVMFSLTLLGLSRRRRREYVVNF